MCQIVFGTSTTNQQIWQNLYAILMKNMQEEVKDMERKIPKNIRQIGNVSDNPKVYVEDYVDTFICQMCDKATESPVGAFLIGESFRKDDQDYIFIHGAVQMQDVEMRGNEVVLGDKTWKKACEEGKRYFAGNTILGWFLTAPGLQVKLNNNLIKLHERLFMKKSRMMILKDSVEKEEAFFVYKYNDLMQIGGHYIYYEKNPSMQEYMIAKRKQNCVTPSETIEDRATKDFRSIIRNKEEKQKEKSKHKYSYMVSTFLVLLLVVIGVTSANDYDRLKETEAIVVSSLSNLLGDDVGSDIDNASGSSVGLDTGNSEEEDTDSKESEEEGATEQVVEQTGELLEGGEEEIQENQNLESANQEDGSQGEDVEGQKSEITGPEVEETQGNENQGAEAQGDEAQGVRTYTVKKGDSLAQICKDVYGVVSHVDEVCELNNLEDSDYIYVGQEILLPE